MSLPTYARPRQASPLGNIRLVATDVDGVLTDGGMYYGQSVEGHWASVEMRRFNTRDGMGVEMLQERGIEVAILTRESTVQARSIVNRRAAKLGIKHVYHGVQDKRVQLASLADELGLELSQVAYIGDDVNDSAALRSCGVSATVADGLPAVKAVVHYVCQLPGGAGAFREFADYLLSGRIQASLQFEQV